MSSVDQVIGFSIVVFFVVLVFVFSSKSIRTRFPVTFRKIEPINRLKKAIGVAVEDGSRLHVSLGSAQLVDPSNTSALIGLNTLQRVGQLTSTSDLPPICTTGSGSLLLLSQDTLKRISKETNTQAFYDPNHATMAGATPFSYAIGTTEAIQNCEVSGNILLGNFGTEAGLLSDSIGKSGISIAGSDSITAQSIFYATTPDTLIGEEVFALPAYLAVSPKHQASLRVEDVFRMIVAGAIIIGAILTAVGVL
jgi:hypothetical protein